MVSMIRKKRNCQAVPDTKTGVVVGIDVSKGRIDYAAFRPDERSKVFSVQQDMKGFSQLKELLDELRCDGYSPWIALEPTGVYSTCLREWLLAENEHVVQVNGFHVKRTKEVRDNSPLKTDQKDPRVIADLVWQGCYQDILQLPQEYAELRGASSEWASLTKKKTVIRNEFQALLEEWFPELRQVFKDQVCKSIRGLVRRYGCVDEIACSRLSSVENALKKASLGRTVGKAGQIHSLAKESIALEKGEKSRHRMMLHLLDMLEIVEAQQEELITETQKMLCAVPESLALMSLPGIGVVTVAGLLGECGPLSGFRSYEQLEKFIGVNLFEVSSGKHKGQKHISKRGRALARYLVCQAALQQIRKGGLFRGYDEELKRDGKKSGQIRVAVARKLLKLMYAIGRDQQEFDQSRFFMGRRTGDGRASTQGTQLSAA